MNSLKKIWIWVTLFAVSMAFMESAVVIYLREIYYKTGFEFPLKSISPLIARVEFFRELATIIMLIGMGIVAGNSKLQRFAYFVYSFAVWDLFYYVFLYVCSGWPQSLSTWDILFLIPVPWVGPVWAPCLLSWLMIVGSVFVIKRTHAQQILRISPLHWWTLIFGAFVCIVSFMWDYLSFTNASSKTWSVLSDKPMFAEIETYIPGQFNYALFFTGFILMLLSVILTIKASNKQNP